MTPSPSSSPPSPESQVVTFNFVGGQGESDQWTLTNSDWVPDYSTLYFTTPAADVSHNWITWDGTTDGTASPTCAGPGGFISSAATIKVLSAGGSTYYFIPESSDLSYGNLTWASFKANGLQEEDNFGQLFYDTFWEAVEAGTLCNPPGDDPMNRTTFGFDFDYTIFIYKILQNTFTLNLVKLGDKVSYNLEWFEINQQTANLGGAGNVLAPQDFEFTVTFK